MRAARKEERGSPLRSELRRAARVLRRSPRVGYGAPGPRRRIRAQHTHNRTATLPCNWHALTPPGRSVGATCARISSCAARGSRSEDLAAAEAAHEERHRGSASSPSHGGGDGVATRPVLPGAIPVRSASPKSPAGSAYNVTVLVTAERGFPRERPFSIQVAPRRAQLLPLEYNLKTCIPERLANGRRSRAPRCLGLNTKEVAINRHAGPS